MIEIKNIQKIFDSFRLGPINFSLVKNEYMAIIGNNGAGKTTIINLICNIISPDKGYISINKKKINYNNNSYKSDLGILLSEPYYLEIFTPKKYILFCSQFQGIKKSEALKRFHSLSKSLNFEQENVKISKLSSGNKMKISLMSALIHNPKILLLDEPFINLDIGTQELFKSILKSFKGRKTLLITSHNLDLVADICDTFLIMDNGKIISRIEKKENTDIDTLKNEIKNLLSQKDQKLNLAWMK